MKLIVGLGNPGRKYKKTRHNVGFRVIDALEHEISDKDIILLKPDTFMNNSGKEVRKIIQKSKVKSQNLIVVHDDIDLLFGTIRISKNISSAGHKGVRSIIDELGSQDFLRVRIGIKPPLLRSSSFGGQNKIDTTDFVLKNFTKAEEKELKEIIKRVIEEIKKILAPSPVPERPRFFHKSGNP